MGSYSAITKNSDGQLEMSFHGDAAAAPITARVLADSITDGGCRLISWVWEYPRMIHAEIMTHRVLSRNSASSRAIPTSVLRRRTLTAPAMPVHWGQNQKGMQATNEVMDTYEARVWWLEGLAKMAEHHEKGERLGLHKQIVNRVIEPWMTIAVIVSATDHANLFHLRKHPDAEPSFQKLATLAWELFHNSLPNYVAPGGWHLPFVRTDDIEQAESTEQLLKLSVGRCARVSYLTHDGQRDRAEDAELHDKLAKTATLGADPMHASPFEHQAMAVGAADHLIGSSLAHHGNFEGWKQYRKMFEHEAGPSTRDRCKRCGCWGGRHVTTCPEAS